MSDLRINTGDRVVLTGTFRDGAGELVDPDVVTITLRPPRAVKIIIAGDDVVRISNGVFEARYIVTKPGLWKWSMTGTGSVVAVEASSFEVYPA